MRIRSSQKNQNLRVAIIEKKIAHGGLSTENELVWEKEMYFSVWTKDRPRTIFWNWCRKKIYIFMFGRKRDREPSFLGVP